MIRKASELTSIYKKQLENSDIQSAYMFLLKYVTSLKAYCQKNFPKEFSFGNVSSGYMDFSYFPFFNDFLRNEKLRFGIVLNHKEMRFELWLMGQNADIQSKYWELMKNSVWNKDREHMPKYSFLDVVLIENPDFDNVDNLNFEINKKATCLSQEILNHLKKINA